MSDEDQQSDIEDDGSLPTEQPTVDAANPVTHARRQTKQLIEREQVRAWWAKNLRDPVGQRVIWAILTDLHTFDDERFACGPNGYPQPEASLHARGQRDFGLRLYRTLVLHDREAVFAMHDEHDPAFAKPKPIRRKKAE